MATYVVRVHDDDQGYADEWIFGGFRTREAAEAFAEKVERRVKDDGVHASVDRVMPPRLRDLQENGWFDEPEPVGPNLYMNDHREG